MLPEKYLFIIVSQRKVRIFNVDGYSNNFTQKSRVSQNKQYTWYIELRNEIHLLWKSDSSSLNAAVDSTPGQCYCWTQSETDK